MLCTASALKRIGVRWTLQNARIYDAGRMDGKPYIRMEYIKGYTVEELRNREGNMSFSRSAIVILHILAGLKHAHEHGVIHRDLRLSLIHI